MKETVLSLFVISILCGLYRFLFPKSQYNAQIRFMLSMLACVSLVCVLRTDAWESRLAQWKVPPLSEEKSEAEQAWEQALLTQAKTYLSEQVETMLLQRFGLKADGYHFSCNLILMGDQTLLTDVTLYLTEENAYMQRDVQRHLTDWLSVEANVEIL